MTIERERETLEQSDAKPVAWAQERIAKVGKAWVNPSTQSNAEPVAWRYRYPADIDQGIDDEWSFTFDKEHADEREENAGCIVEPLYTAPPRPDASAELIEAAEWHEQKARTTALSCAKEIHLACAEALRARAADRIGK